MQKRDFQEAVSHAPLKLKLGDVMYDVEPLRRGASRKWKVKVAEVVSKIVNRMNPEPPADASREELSTWLSEAFSGEVVFALASHPDAIAELLLAYAPNLTEEILDTATQEQIHLAYGQIMAVEHPFFSTVGTLKEMMANGSLTASPAPKYTN